MLYYITHRGTGTRLYRSRRDAALLLTRYKTELEAGGQILIDYLLLPTSLEALIFCPFPIKEGSEVPHHLVLDLLAHLARMGRLWPFSGTWELYNGGPAFAELGKSGSELLPYPLSVIIDAKRDSATVRGDQAP